MCGLSTHQARSKLQKFASLRLAGVCQSWSAAISRTAASTSMCTQPLYPTAPTTGGHLIHLRLTVPRHNTFLLGRRPTLNYCRIRLSFSLASSHVDTKPLHVAISVLSALCPWARLSLAVIVSACSRHVVNAFLITYQHYHGIRHGADVCLNHDG